MFQRRQITDFERNSPPARLLFLTPVLQLPISIARAGCGSRAFAFLLLSQPKHSTHPTEEKAGPVRRAAGHEHEGKMFAVIKTGGKQYRVAAEDKLKVEKVAGEPGEIIQFGDVLVVGGEAVTLGSPTVSGASVAAEVLDQGRGPKVIAFKKRRRKNSRRRRGHRQEFTLVRITEILTDGAKPTITARPKREPKPVATPEVEGQTAAADEAPKAKAKAKPAAKAKTAKKSAAKTAKKPAAAKSKGKRQKK
jgi:large subunit ribosomal protein L21